MYLDWLLRRYKTKSDDLDPKTLLGLCIWYMPLRSFLSADGPFGFILKSSATCFTAM